MDAIPALAKLKNFRFIDLSQNHGLFEAEPSALSLLRRYAELFSYPVFLGKAQAFFNGDMGRFPKVGSLLAVR